ncbi:MAG TPA: RsmE family RNA methyltransferase [Vicinamibacterales bacterium]|nr:RsmE family RNA methyltransferase [Vicinamibacterales bacterium]
MNLILLDPAEVTSDGTVTLRDGRARHLLTVLEVTTNQEVRVGLLDGPAGTGRVLAAADGAVILACSFGDTPLEPPVDLLLALPRPKVLHRLWAQFAALGVGRIVLTNAARVERQYFDTHVLDERVYRPLLIEGLQQARDTRVPRVSIHRQFRILVEDDLETLCPGTARLLADPSGELAIGRALSGAGGSRVLLAVGPEGGWNAFEHNLLLAHGFRTVAIGSRPLRSDTACIALLALVHESLRAT